jgi:hypothetical protein
MEKKELRVSLPSALVQEVINYLETRPCKEVAYMLYGQNGIAGTQKPVVEDPEKQDQKT